MVNDPVDLRAIREQLASARIAEDITESIVYCYHFERTCDDFINALARAMDTIERIVVTGAGDVISEDIRLDPEVLSQVGEYIFAAKGAFKSAREALGACGHSLEASGGLLLRELNRKIDKTNSGGS